MLDQILVIRAECWMAVATFLVSVNYINDRNSRKKRCGNAAAAAFVIQICIGHARI